ncbi:MAG TPA: 5-formyltetrahydrofolate cyclo-ligase [Sandaracinaceae bacterium LLY-WYZ-13_1]|nr:5-formyltetrahydrofolate cyclo-ligase [Sandaracinaceae bacterium LLY-WYZ-13_1]
MTAKPELRERAWRALEAAGAARFPGARGRIPNFVGAEAAAKRLAEIEPFRSARVLKCNPDSPQRPVRHAALKAGKVVLMAVPKLAERALFLRLDPDRIDDLWKASSIKGAGRVGERITEREAGVVDLVVTGCVAVAPDGARLGKGGGYSDLEYALLRELELVDADTPIVTTVHDCQVRPAGAIPMDAHDISLDLYCTPERTVRCDRAYRRPRGVDLDRLDRATIEAIPVLAERFEG